MAESWARGDCTCTLPGSGVDFGQVDAACPLHGRARMTVHRAQPTGAAVRYDVDILTPSMHPSCTPPAELPPLRFRTEWTREEVMEEARRQIERWQGVLDRLTELGD